MDVVKGLNLHLLKKYICAAKGHGAAYRPYKFSFNFLWGLFLTYFLIGPLHLRLKGETPEA